jgi:hypothetical protein
VTGPVTDPPPSGPGRVDVLDREPVNGLDDESLRAIRVAVAGAPPITGPARAALARLFQPGPPGQPTPPPTPRPQPGPPPPR